MYDTSHNNFRIHRYLHAYELVLYCRRFLYAVNTMGSQNVQWRNSDIDPLYAWMLHLKLHSCINFDSFSMCLKRPWKDAKNRVSSLWTCVITTQRRLLSENAEVLVRFWAWLWLILLDYSVRGLKIVKILKYAKFRTSLLNEWICCWVNVGRGILVKWCEDNHL